MRLVVGVFSFLALFMMALSNVIFIVVLLVVILAIIGFGWLMAHRAKNNWKL